MVRKKIIAQYEALNKFKVEEVLYRMTPDEMDAIAFDYAQDDKYLVVLEMKQRTQEQEMV